MGGWTAKDIPDLTGRRVVVTGANSGLGFATARELARAGAAVVMAARDPARGSDAVDRIRRHNPSANVQLATLDLSDLTSVREFATEQGAEPVDVLVNNAGVMAIPRRETVDGFETQFATNHLGHFALTGLLLPALLRRSGSRVVTVSSFMHRLGVMNFGDLMGEVRYDPWKAYSQSKLANLLFMRELHRRFGTVGLVSVAAHPGYSSTNLQGVGPRMTGNRLSASVASAITKVVAQSAAKGALPQLYAATAPSVRGGDYVGPRGPGQLRGRPRLVGMNARARDDAQASQLWDISEQLTGVRYSDPTGL